MGDGRGSSRGGRRRGAGAPPACCHAPNNTQSRARARARLGGLRLLPDLLGRQQDAVHQRRLPQRRVLHMGGREGQRVRERMGTQHGCSARTHRQLPPGGERGLSRAPASPGTLLSACPPAQAWQRSQPPCQPGRSTQQRWMRVGVAVLKRRRQMWHADVPSHSQNHRAPPRRPRTAAASLGHACGPWASAASPLPPASRTPTPCTPGQG